MTVLLIRAAISSCRVIFLAVAWGGNRWMKIIKGMWKAAEDYNPVWDQWRQPLDSQGDSTSHADSVWETSLQEVACATSKLQVDISFTLQTQLRKNKEQEMNLCCRTRAQHCNSPQTQSLIEPNPTHSHSVHLMKFCSRLLIQEHLFILGLWLTLTPSCCEIYYLLWPWRTPYLCVTQGCNIDPSKRCMPLPWTPVHTDTRAHTHSPRKTI